jgi:hypothetical protein
VISALGVPDCGFAVQRSPMCWVSQAAANASRHCSGRIAKSRSQAPVASNSPSAVIW